MSAHPEGEFRPSDPSSETLDDRPAAPLPNRPAAPASGAQLLHEVYLAYRDQFDLVTRRAHARFERQDWSGAQRDARERLLLYSQFVGWVQRDITALLGSRSDDHRVWASLKERYAGLTQGSADCEIARTFFNSVARRVHQTVGISPDTEFLDCEYYGSVTGDDATLRHYPVAGNVAATFDRMLDDLQFTGQFEDRRRDVELAAEAFGQEVARLAPGKTPEAIEVWPAAYYRNKAAYVVGRVMLGEELLPLVVALVHRQDGLAIDAVLLSTDDVSVVFGFTRSYFHVDAPNPAGAVRFLHSIMDGKRAHELYTAIGFNRHGKSELYRTLRAEFSNRMSCFEPAEGEPGLVMNVFRYPSLQVVFKVIRDRFGAPKRTTRRAVRDKYQLVFVHDRVGRLADAQEFEHLEFKTEWFAPELLTELQRNAGRTVQVDDDRVVIRHLYTERQVEPLDVFLARAPAETAERAIVGYGNTIRDLAAANIFTGDMLLKNFGVTRHGRVIFYDYDELCLLTDCRFRRLPEAVHPEDEMAAEPWFHVGDSDVFPEQFRPFLVPNGRLGEVFLEHHAELLTVDYWLAMQQRQRAGEVVEFFPYPQARRLGKAVGW